MPKGSCDPKLLTRVKTVSTQLVLALAGGRKRCVVTEIIARVVGVTWLVGVIKDYRLSLL